MRNKRHMGKVRFLGSRQQLQHRVSEAMKILKVEPVTISYHVVTFENGEYERYSSDNWRERFGESTETVFYPEKLEAAFQALYDHIANPDKMIK